MPHSTYQILETLKNISFKLLSNTSMQNPHVTNTCFPNQNCFPDFIPFCLLCFKSLATEFPFPRLRVKTVYTLSTVKQTHFLKPESLSRFLFFIQHLLVFKQYLILNAHVRSTLSCLHDCETPIFLFEQTACKILL